MILLVPHWESAAFWPRFAAEDFQALVEQKMSIALARRFLIPGTQRNLARNIGAPKFSMIAVWARAPSQAHRPSTPEHGWVGQAL
jgi:hypothetical protein